MAIVSIARSSAGTPGATLGDAQPTLLTTSPPTRCDSVMPGSLGLEAMHQTLELWCVHAGLGGGKRDATFSHELGKTAWKYRGQLTPKAERCDVEVHVLTNPYPYPYPHSNPNPNSNPNPHPHPHPNPHS
eukprot:scaffold13103_cov62-Phaeocystis_antarctica.AAC.3